MHPNKHEIADNREITRNVDIKTLPPPIQHLWYLASCMGLGWGEIIRLASGGKNGFTRDFLKDLERNCCSRETVSDTDPPLFVKLERQKEGGTTMRMQRWSENLKAWEEFFALKGDMITFKGEISYPGEDALKNNIIPALKKLNAANGGIVRYLTRSGPNHILFRNFFQTHPKDAWWLQYSSPKLKEEDFKPSYRLYVNPRIHRDPQKGLQQYGEVIAKTVKTARNYHEPLLFKLMFAGREAPSVILEPDSSKIVFYFRTKEAAIRFGDHLAEKLGEKGIKGNDSAALKQRYVPQRVWRQGLLILGKGTREDRRDIVRQLEDVRTQTRRAILAKAKELSITY